MAAVTSYEYPTAIGSLTITSGQSLTSDYLDLQGCRLTGIEMPAAWTAASLTFQVSKDNITYVNLYNLNGEVAYPAGASYGVSFNAEDFLSWRYVKVRSGTAGAAVAQGADRTLVLVGSALA